MRVFVGEKAIGSRNMFHTKQAASKGDWQFVHSSYLFSFFPLLFWPGNDGIQYAVLGGLLYLSRILFCSYRERLFVFYIIVSNLDSWTLFGPEFSAICVLFVRIM